jgi:hypothetical protein
MRSAPSRRASETDAMLSGLRRVRQPPTAAAHALEPKANFQGVSEGGKAAQA